MKTPIITPFALSDLDDIWLYIAQDNEEAADYVIDKIYAAIERLGDMPNIGHTREDLIDKPLLFWPVYSYLVVYIIEQDHIEIVRVINGQRDVSKLV